MPDAKTPEEGLARTERFLTQWKGHALITPAVAPHALYTLEAATLKACRALADKHQVPLIIHLAETRAEVDAALTLANATPTQYLQGVGLWGPRTLAAHGVWVSPEDMTVLKAAGVAVSHNPESNMKLASGTAPVVDYLAAGVTVGLGTDGAASNNDLDMFEAMRFAAFLQKHARNDPRALPAPAVLDMATRDGAAALGLGAQVGSARSRQARRRHHGRHARAAADADVRSGGAPGLQRARRRRHDDDRQRQGADARPEGADAERGGGAGGRARRGRDRPRGGEEVMAGS